MHKLAFEGKLSVVIMKQGKRFVAHSPALDLSTSGKSEKDARKRFQEIVQVFFEEVIEAGTLKKVLTELGWQMKNNHLEPPTIVSKGSINVRVPIMA